MQWIPRKKAKRKLRELRKRCKIGDVVSPIGEVWEAEVTLEPV